MGGAVPSKFLFERRRYNFAVWVAESNPKIKKETVQAIETFLNNYLVDLK